MESRQNSSPQATARLAGCYGCCLSWACRAIRVRSSLIVNGMRIHREQHLARPPLAAAFMADFLGQFYVCESVLGELLHRRALFRGLWRACTGRRGARSSLINLAALLVLDLFRPPEAGPLRLFSVCTPRAILSRWSFSGLLPALGVLVALSGFFRGARRCYFRRRLLPAVYVQLLPLPRSLGSCSGGGHPLFIAAMSMTLCCWSSASRCRWQARAKPRFQRDRARLLNYRRSTLPFRHVAPHTH